MIITSVNLTALNSGVGQTPENVLVTDESTVIVGENISRSSVFLMNLGKDDVWISCDAAARFEKGMLVGNGGGSMLVDATAFTTGPINGICQGGRTSIITLQELIK